MIIKFRHLSKKKRLFLAYSGFFLVILVGIVDMLTGYELAFSLFYLLPISLTTWFGNNQIALATILFCSITWYAADSIAGHPYSHTALPLINATIRFGVFLIISLLLRALRNSYEYEQKLARTDYLTGAVNTGFFYEMVQLEIERSRRSQKPFTIAYMDLDNFKYVNDNFGHSTGDKVLINIVKLSKHHLRKTDTVGRLGGDEFVILLPETDQEEARIVMSKLQTHLLDEMQTNHWPVTFSIGVMTCIKLPPSTHEVIKQTDDLMYTVKKSGKNAVTYAVYSN